MRLILEKNEIVAILSKHFDAVLDPEKVIIRTEPFEIEVCALPLSVKDPEPKSNVVPLRVKEGKTKELIVEDEAPLRDDPDASTEPPPPGTDGIQKASTDFHPAAVLAESERLQRELDAETPSLKRRSGRWSETAPPNSDDEV